MKRLVSLPLDPEQHHEIVRVLREAGIAFREVESFSRLFSSDAIWVEDKDFARARALLRTEADAFAAKRRGQWQAEWVSDYAGSYTRWFWSRLRAEPVATLIKVALLLVVIGLLLAFPMLFVVG